MADLCSGGLAATKTLSNEGKTHRHGLDIWERQMMERDRRLTGTIRYVLDPNRRRSEPNFLQRPDG